MQLTPENWPVGREGERQGRIFEEGLAPLRVSSIDGSGRVGLLKNIILGLYYGL